MCRDVYLLIYVRMMELCVCDTNFLFYYISFCVQSKGKFPLFIDTVLYFVTGRQDYPGGQDFTGGQGSSRVTGGQAFMEDGAGLRRMAGVCWRMGLLLEDSVHGRQDFAGGCSELYISLCKNEGVVCMCCVTAVCAWTDFGVCMPHRLT